MTRPRRIRFDKDDEITQLWGRNVDNELSSVSAARLRGEDEWPWEVVVPVAEFLREEPLESDFRSAVIGALLGVRGVREAAEEDREVWLVSGRPRGKALVAAVGAALDALQPRIRQHMETLAATAE